jgi:hypothetical protein
LSDSPQVVLKHKHLVWNYAVKHSIKAPPGFKFNGAMGSAWHEFLRLVQKFGKIPVTGLYDIHTDHLVNPPPVATYGNPYRHLVNGHYNGHDHGVDWTGHGPIFAAGPGVVTVVNNSSGWVGGHAMTYEITEGMAKGKSVYIAENISIPVHVGQRVDFNTPVAFTQDAYPWTESGWAMPGTDTYFPADRNTSPYGINFARFLRKIGAPIGVVAQNAGLPSGWPVWD